MRWWDITVATVSLVGDASLIRDLFPLSAPEDGFDFEGVLETCEAGGFDTNEDSVLTVPAFVMADEPPTLNFLVSQLKSGVQGRARGYGVLEKLIGCLVRRAHLNPTLSAGSDASTRPSHTLPPLIHAVLQQNDLAVRALIDAGVNPATLMNPTSNSSHVSAIHLALNQNQHASVLKGMFQHLDWMRRVWQSFGEFVSEDLGDAIAALDGSVPGDTPSPEPSFTSLPESFSVPGLQRVFNIIATYILGLLLDVPDATKPIQLTQDRFLRTPLHAAANRGACL